MSKLLDASMRHSSGQQAKEELTSGRPCRFGIEVAVDAAARNSADLASPKILLGSLEDIHRRVLERHMPRAFAVTTLLVVEAV